MEAGSDEKRLGVKILRRALIQTGKFLGLTKGGRGAG